MTIDFSNEWDEWLSEGSDVKEEPEAKPVPEKPIPKKEPKELSELKLRKPNKHITKDENKPLTQQQELFCQLYVKTSNGKQSAIEAGYSENGADVTASHLIRRASVAKRIKELKEKLAKPHIASAEDVMKYFSDVMQGKIKDQFGLEASLSDRTKAAIELAKRTVDIDQRLAGKPDATVEIKLDWKRED